MRKTDSGYGRGNKTRDMVLIALFAVILSVCAWISIPSVIPFTLQTFGVFLAVGVLGGRRGTAVICLYLLLGALGVPVFSGGTSGIGVLLGQAGGYMIGWIFAGLVMWLSERIFGRKRKALACAMLLGMIVYDVCGTIWYLVFYAGNTGTAGIWNALLFCVFPFLIPDLLKIALALAVQKRLAGIAE